jgi:hypothetical protein
MNNPSHTKKTSRSALLLFAAFAAIAGLVSSASAQTTPTPSPTWPPPQGSADRNQLIKAIAALLRESVDPSSTLRGRLKAPDSAKTELVNKLAGSLTLPPEMVIVFFEPDAPAEANCTVQRKNGLYSILALVKEPIPPTMTDKQLVNSHFMCCYDPY